MFAFPRLTKVVKVILIVHAVAFLFQLIDPIRSLAFFSLYLAKSDIFSILSLSWRIFTYTLVSQGGSIINLLFYALFMFFVATSLEQSWGSKVFLAFYLTVVGVSGLISFFVFSLLGGAIITGTSGITFAIILVYAYFSPNVRFYLFGIFPFKVKWLLLVSIVLALFGGVYSITLQFSAGIVSFLFIFIMFDLPSWIAPYAKGPKNFVEDIKDNLRSRNKQPEIKIFKNKYYQNNSYEADIVEEAYDEPITSDEQEVDRILDKVSKYGVDTLTKKEKAFLDEIGKDYKSGEDHNSRG